MTENQATIFRRVLDTNWELKELQEAGKWAAAFDKMKEHQAVLKEFKESMGEKAFEEFMDNGRKMFSPIGSNE
jgi:hypothetical protein